MREKGGRIAVPDVRSGVASLIPGTVGRQDLQQVMAGETAPRLPSGLTRERTSNVRRPSQRGTCNRGPLLNRGRLRNSVQIRNSDRLRNSDRHLSRSDLPAGRDRNRR